MNKSKSVAFIVLGIIGICGAGAAYAGPLSPPTLEISAPAQPKESLAIPGAQRVPFTTIQLRAVGADITVQSITVVHTGIADETVYDSIVLLDENGDLIADDKRLKEGQVIFDEPFVIPKGALRTLTIGANMAGDLAEFEGQRPALTITDVRAYIVQPVSL